MALERKCTVVQKAILLAARRNHWWSRLYIVDEQFAVQVNLYVLAPDCHCHAKRLLVCRQLLVHVAQPIKRAGLLPFQVTPVPTGRVVHLNFEAFLRKATLLVGV